MTNSGQVNISYTGHYKILHIFSSILFWSTPSCFSFRPHSRLTGKQCPYEVPKLCRWDFQSSRETFCSWCFDPRTMSITKGRVSHKVLEQLGEPCELPAVAASSPQQAQSNEAQEKMLKAGGAGLQIPVATWATRSATATLNSCSCLRSKWYVSQITYSVARLCPIVGQVGV